MLNYYTRISRLFHRANHRICLIFLCKPLHFTYFLGNIKWERFREVFGVLSRLDRWIQLSIHQTHRSFFIFHIFVLFLDTTKPFFRRGHIAAGGLEEVFFMQNIDTSAACRKSKNRRRRDPARRGAAAHRKRRGHPQPAMWRSAPKWSLPREPSSSQHHPARQDHHRRRLRHRPQHFHRGQHR